jgi:uncharacterized membrane protein
LITNQYTIIMSPQHPSTLSKTQHTMTTPTNIILIITATTTALIAGLFYAWSCSVTLGLARLSDYEYIVAMQSMNRAILNPVFFMTFIGTVLLLPLSTYLHYGYPIRFWLLLAATIIYIVGVFGVTMVGNVPLNEALDAFNLQSASTEQMATLRAKFESPWNNLNTIRTIASTITIILVIIACVAHSNE